MTNDGQQPRSDRGQSRGDNSGSLSRRGILSWLAVGGAGAAAGGAWALEEDEDRDGADESDEQNEGTTGVDESSHVEANYELRVAAAERMLEADAEHPVVDDHQHSDANPEGYAARFTKGLSHDTDGRVDETDYQSLLDAIETGSVGELDDTVRKEGNRELIDPLAGQTYSLVGANPREIAIPEPPAFDSAQQAGELVELYWQALLRDVPFRDYATNDLAQAAAAELSELDTLDDRRLTDDGEVTPDILFRGPLPGSDIGPYTSQFLLRETTWGAHNVPQQIQTHEPGEDYLSDRQTWFSNIEGTSLDDDEYLAAPGASTQNFDEQFRYIRTGRDMTACVQRDVIGGQFLLAISSVIGRPVDGVPDNPEELYDSGNPYSDGDHGSHAFLNFARTGFFDLVLRASRTALMAAWFQKWHVHRRARPEKLAGLVDMTLASDADWPLDEIVLNSEAVQRVHDEYGTYLLPQAYAEGSPTHPAYPGGHATSAAAAATVIKAVMNEDHQLDEIVLPAADGLSTEPYAGPDREELTIETEINKLVDNVNYGGRHFAGVHYPSDTLASYELGEQVAIRLLEDAVEQTVEEASFEFTGFDGQTVRVS